MKKTTHEEFVKRLNKTNSNILVEGIYTGGRNKLLVRNILCNHEWNAWPSDLLRGRDCPICSRKNSGLKMRMTQEEFVSKVKSVLPTIDVKGEYLGNKERISVKCSICGNEWSPVAQGLLGGHGCGKCAKNSSLSDFEFFELSSAANKNIDVIGEYIKLSSPILVECKECNYRWSPVASSLLKEKKCPRCCKQKKRTHEEFVYDLKEKHPSLTVLGEYQNNITKIQFVCNICHYTWVSTPKSVMKSCGCPNCQLSLLKRQNTKPIDDFVNDLHKINPNISVLGKYVNSKTKIEVSCDICRNTWVTIPNSILRAGKCPFCTNKRVLKGFNDLATTHPELCLEWDPSNEILPSEVVSGSVKKVSWIGSCGHNWVASVASRVKGSGCAVCANNTRKTKEQFIEELWKVNKTIDVVGEYINANTKITVKCTVCGDVWKSTPARLLAGAQCQKCIRPSTSFMEQFLYFSFLQMLNGESVLSRDKTAIGMELDIYIPNRKIAIEPGSWLYHKNKKSNDELKRKECFKKGIRLFTIYDTFPENEEKPFENDCYVYSGFYNEPGYTNIISVVETIADEMHISNKCLDWDEIASKAYEACHYNANDEFVEKMSIVAPEIRILEPYKGSAIPIRVCSIKCNHGEWMARPYTLLKGIGCPTCSKESASKRRTKSHEEFCGIVSEVNPDICVVGHYTKAVERIDVKCLLCGHEWRPKASSLMYGKGCPHCSAIKGSNNNTGKTARKTTEQFANEIREKNPNVRVIGEYVNNKTKIEVKCEKCGEVWFPVAASLSNGHGCPKCSRYNRTKK